MRVKFVSISLAIVLSVCLLSLSMVQAATAPERFESRMLDQDEVPFDEDEKSSFEEEEEIDMEMDRDEHLDQDENPRAEENEESSEATHSGQELCVGEEALQFIRQKKPMTVTPYVTSEENADDELTKVHVIDVDYETTYIVPDLMIEYYFLSNGHKYILEPVQVDREEEGSEEGWVPPKSVQLRISHDDLISWDSIDITKFDENTTQYSTTFVVSFYNTCVSEFPSKNYEFNFKVVVSSHFLGQISVISNTATEHDQQCEGTNGCTTVIPYEANLELTNDSWDGPAESEEFSPGDYLFTTLRVSGNFYDFIEVVSIKEILPENRFVELSGRSFTEIHYPETGFAQIKTMITVAQSFEFRVEAKTAESGSEESENGRRRLDESSERSEKLFYSGIVIEVVPKKDTHSSSVNDVEDNKGENTNSSLFKYLFFGILLFFFAFVAYVFAHRTSAMAKKRSGEARNTSIEMEDSTVTATDSSMRGTKGGRYADFTVDSDNYI